MQFQNDKYQNGEPTSHYFNTMYRAAFIILYYHQQMHNYLTNYHTPTCFDTIVSSSGSLESIAYQFTQVFQIQMLVDCVWNVMAHGEAREGSERETGECSR